MIDKERVLLFEQAPIPRAVVSMCVPMVISSLVNVIYSLADTWFVGLINDPVQSAAITIASPLMMLYNAVTALFGVGCSSLMSRLIGVKQEDKARRVAADGIFFSVFFGILFSLLYGSFPSAIHEILGASGENIPFTAAYLKWTVAFGAMPSILNVTAAYLIRSEGASLAASIGTMSGCVLNMLLDPIFIMPWGLNLGAEGAGLATFLSNCAACVYFIVYILRKRGKTLITLDPKQITVEKTVIKGILAVGIPALTANFLTVASQVILTHLTTNFGSDSATAAMGIAFRVDLIPSNVCHGLSTGIMPLIGYNYASGDHKRMRDATFYIFKLSMAVIVTVTILYLIFAETLIGCFIQNEEVIQFGAIFLRGLCIALPFYCVDFVSAGVFQACGLGKYSMMLPIFRNAVLEIPAFFVLDRLFSVYGLPYAYIFAEGILSIAVLFVLRHMFRDLDRPRSVA